MKEFIVVTVKELFKTWNTYTDAQTAVDIFFLGGLILTSSFVLCYQKMNIWISCCKTLYKQITLAYMSMSSKAIILLA